MVAVPVKTFAQLQTNYLEHISPARMPPIFYKLIASHPPPSRNEKPKYTVNKTKLQFRTHTRIFSFVILVNSGQHFEAT